MCKMIRELLPSNVRCSAEARDLIQTCCEEFVTMLTQECSDICEKSNKKTISPEHVIEALTLLEFEEYVADVSGVHHKQAAAQTNERHKRKRNDLSALSAEAATEQQRRLFDNARTRYEQDILQISNPASPLMSPPLFPSQPPPFISMTLTSDLATQNASTNETTTTQPDNNSPQQSDTLANDDSGGSNDDE
eukprot:c3449_g1_i2.p1 GENE.c3449_g1_i2~~c3449_g1_i2.p1  ORF type:complete len:210 (-),score=61.05 c3449_g1_i2:25-600(-)